MGPVKDTESSRELKPDREPLTSIQEVVDALVFPQGREVQIIHQRIQAVLWREERGYNTRALEAAASTGGTSV